MKKSPINTLISIINFSEVENIYCYFPDLITVENLIKEFKENGEKFKEKKVTNLIILNGGIYLGISLIFLLFFLGR